MTQTAIAEVRLDAIPGQEQAIRATEIACAGRHSITYIALDNDSVADDLAAWAEENGATPYVIAPCPCGHLGSKHHECTCSPRSVARWFRRREFANDLVVDIAPAWPEQIINMLSGKRVGEPDELILQRINNPLPPPETITGHASDLLSTAIQRFGLTTGEALRIAAVARTIARLDGATCIDAQHVAEAIQYRPQGG